MTFSPAPCECGSRDAMVCVISEISGGIHPEDYGARGALEVQDAPATSPRNDRENLSICRRALCAGNNTPQRRSAIASHQTFCR